MVDKDESRTRTVTLSVTPRSEVVQRMRSALAGERQGAFINFPTVELLWKVITPKRLDILRALVGQEALSIREMARRPGRDVKAVHGDVHALVDIGLLDLAEAEFASATMPCMSIVTCRRRR